MNWISGRCVLGWIAAVAFAIGGNSVAAKEAALVTAVSGAVQISSQALEPFVKLHVGDEVALGSGASVKLVFFLARREETWKGPGKLRITGAGGTGTQLPEPVTRELPESLVRQISKTPAVDSQGRAGMTRLRNLGSAEAVAKLEGEYMRMRKDAPDGDTNPELYLLSGLYEMQEFDRLDSALRAVEGRIGKTPELAGLVTRYRRLAELSK